MLATSTDRHGEEELSRLQTLHWILITLIKEFFFPAEDRSKQQLSTLKLASLT